MNTRFGAWLRLGRITNLPSALSNILMGYWLAAHSFSESGRNEIGLILVASASFYIAGMILNDVFDVEKDRQERPERPIPSGAISLRSARFAGFFLLAAGFGFTIASVAANKPSDFLLVRSLSIGILLPICILLYDSVLKATFVAPFLMGACRSLNVLLGASTVIAEDSFLGFSGMVWAVSLIVGIYVAGITWFARHETRSEGGFHLWLGAGLIGAGLASINFLPLIWPVGGSVRQLGVHGFLLAVTLVIFWRIGQALRFRKPKLIQAAVIICLFSLILLDALFALIATPNQLIGPVVIISLSIASNMLRKIIPPT